MNETGLRKRKSHFKKRFKPEYNSDKRVREHNN